MNRHASQGSAFARSAGGAASRGIALVVVAVVIGIVLLRFGLDDPGDDVISGGGPVVTTETTTTPPDSGSTDPTTPGQTTVPSTPETPATTIAPNTIPVLVANGARVSGAAGRVGLTLTAAGFVVKPADNITGTEVLPTTTVYFTAGQEQAAQQVAAALGVTAVAAIPDPLPVDDLAGATVLVALGTDKATAGT